MKFKISLFLLLVISITVTAVAQRYQRMGIAKGAYRLSPKGSKNVASFCMDYSLKAPKKGVILDNVLAGGDAIVRIGNETFTLNEAISKGYIAIEGVNNSFSTMMNNLDEFLRSPDIPDDIRIELSTLKSLWDDMTPADRREFLQMPDIKEIDQQLRNEGDHTKLTFINRTEKPVSIEFINNGVIASGGGHSRNINSELITNTNKTNQAKVQQIIWNSEYQQVLVDLGIYTGKADGIVGPQTKKAIAAFQTENKLPATGIIDKATEILLRQKERIIHFAGENQLARYATIEFSTEGEGLYKLDLGEKGYAYIGNDVNELMIKLNMVKPEQSAYYLNFKGFNTTRTENFMASARMSQSSIEPGKTVQSLKQLSTKGFEATELEDVLLNRNSSFKSLTEVKPVAGGGYSFSLTFKNSYNKSRDWLLTVYGKVETTVRQGWTSFRKIFKPGEIKNISIADAVASAKQDIKSSLNITNEDLEIRLSHELISVIVNIINHRSREILLAVANPMIKQY